MTITDEMYEAAAIAFYGGLYPDVAKEVHLQALRDAVAAAAPLIEAARLRAFADELVGRRDEIDARTCSATSSDTTCAVSGAAWSWPRAWLAQPLTTMAPAARETKAPPCRWCGEPLHMRYSNTIR